MNSKRLDRQQQTCDFWAKREVVYYLLSILVFFVHISSFFNYTYIGELSAFSEGFRNYISNCITGFAVPLYFIISGALFFRDYKTENYLPKLKKRVRTLLLPYLIWNTLWLIFDLICSYTPISNYFTGRQVISLDLGTILNAIFHYGRNLPFWFVFALMFFILLSPLFDLLLRNKYVGIAVIVGIWGLSLFGIGLPTPFFFKQNSIVFYLIGALIGKHCFAPFTRPRTKRTQAISLPIVILSTIPLFFFPKYRTTPLEIALDDILNLIGAFGFWFAADLFVHKLCRFYCIKTSFAVFALHVNVSAIVTKILFLLLPKRGIFAIPNFVLTVIITLTLIALFQWLMSRYFPKTASILFAANVKPKTAQKQKAGLEV